MARRSARLRNASATINTPTKQLESVKEQAAPIEEVQVEITDTVMEETPAENPATPASGKIRPPMSEMHPSRYHHSTLPRPTPGDRFVAITGSADVPTPSKSSVKQVKPASPFVFKAAANPVATLGAAAQRVRDEIAEETARIKLELMTQANNERKQVDITERKIAQPKGRSGRFSDAHKAQFASMSSIADHPSAFRAKSLRTAAATPEQTMPQVRGLKRTQSKANLDEPASALKKPTSNSVKKTVRVVAPDEPQVAKRVKQRVEDDASTNRPVSRDGTLIPKPATASKDTSGLPRSSTLSSLMTPTKASLAKAGKTPVVFSSTRPQSMSKRLFGSGLPRSTTTNNLTKSATPKSTFRDGLDKVKSLWERDPLKMIPNAAISPSAMVPICTPLNGPSPHTSKALPPLPLVSPQRRIAQPKVSTPFAKSVAVAQNSPSPIKSGIPRSKTTNQLVSYPSMPLAAPTQNQAQEVKYPDLTEALGHSSVKKVEHVDDARVPIPTLTSPSTFTFRADHTISSTNATPTRFGSRAGQASLRTVRPSIAPAPRMPGAFPMSISSNIFEGESKENEDPRSVKKPAVAKPMLEFKVIEHGLPSKKRRRFEDGEDSSEDSADKEAADRAAKKQKSRLDEDSVFKSVTGNGIVRSKGVFASPVRRTPGKPLGIAGQGLGSAKKTPVKGISANRLAWLSRPKNRK